MNLINLFNFNYLKQNLKKSKGALAIFIGIIPIINILMLFLMSERNYNTNIITLTDISIINCIGIYILPIIISICLFGYVFKRKSVDFVNSMPISRKSIFITNTIGGICILVLMNLINAIFIYILSSTLPNLIIPLSMIIDYFILWTVTYVFVFTVSNVAVSLSGNMITSIAISALILFLIPFMHFFTYEALIPSHNNEYFIECTDNECVSDVYYSYNSNYVNLSKDHKYMMTFDEKQFKKTYNIPASLILGQIEYRDHNTFYDTSSIFKTFILSLFYIVIGYILFMKRKMEISQTSFKNPIVHNIVKSLTMIPILSFVYLILKESSLDITSTLILLVIIIAYYFIFDLITKKSINGFKLNIISLIIYIPLFMLIMLGLDRITSVKTFNVNEIDAVNIQDLSDGEMNPILSNTFIEDKDFITYLLKNSAYGSYEVNNYELPYINLNFKIDNKLLYTQILFKEKDYEYIKNYLKNNKELKQEVENIDYKDSYVVKLGDLILEEKDIEEISSLCNKYLPREVIVSNSIGLRMNLYTYTNHKVNDYEVYTTNKDITKKIMEIENKYLKDKIDSFDSHELNISGYVNNMHYNIKEINDIDLLNYVKENINNKVDPNYDYGYISIYDYIGGREYRYYTNDVEELTKLLEQFKIDEEYYYD